MTHYPLTPSTQDVQSWPPQPPIVQDSPPHRDDVDELAPKPSADVFEQRSGTVFTLHTPHQDQDVGHEGEPPTIPAVDAVLSRETLGERVQKPHIVVDVQELGGQESGISSVVPIPLRPSDVESLHKTASI